MIGLESQSRRIESFESREVTGSVTSVRGMSVLVSDLPLPIGSIVELKPNPQADQSNRGDQRGEVVGFENSQSVVMLMSVSQGIKPGTSVVGIEPGTSVLVSREMVGRVIDAFGRPIDSGHAFYDTEPWPINPSPTHSLHRSVITEPLITGVRAVDGLVTLGRGQRVGVISSAGCGKSTLLGIVARNADVDVSVIGLIGERGGEVRDFIVDTLGDEGMKRSVVVASTSDESPLVRVRAALVASTVAEYFRSDGANVLLMMDSLTRFAHAQRQIGITIGEHPTMRGYTPSVFAALSGLLERAGAIEGQGSITGLYSILTEGEDMTDPIADAARSMLDGHIVLAPNLASRRHYPAVDPIASISRLADAVCTTSHVESRRKLLRLIAAYSEVEELISIGAYAKGSNPLSDAAIALKPQLDAFLQQGAREKSELKVTVRKMIELANHGCS